MHAIASIQATETVPTGYGTVKVDETLQRVSVQGFIQFHPALAERLGFKAALFMGHALYWSRHLARTQPKRNGWFFMTARQWEQATGLTTREQASVRELLVEQKLLIERIAGKPARMHFRVDLTQLANWAGLHADEDGGSSITWEAFSPWMRACISFYRPLVDAGGSVASGLYLSYLLQAQRAETRSGGDSDGFFPVSQEDVRIALCLGPKTQRNARDKLKALGLLHERYGLARVDLEALSSRLSEVRPEHLARPLRQHATAKVRMEAAAITATGRMSVTRQLPFPAATPEIREVVVQAARMTARMFAPASALAQNKQDGTSSSAAEVCQPSAVLSKLEPALLSKPGPQVAENANQSCRFVETNLPFCRTHIQELNKYPTTTTGAGGRERDPSFDKTASRRRSLEEFPDVDGSRDQLPSAQLYTEETDSRPALTLPAALAPEWHAAVQQTLASAPQSIQQALLDELAGQLAIAGKTIANPPGYLHALIRKHATGTLVLAMADQVATARSDRHRHQAALDRALNGLQDEKKPSAGTREVPTGSDSVAAMNARERLRELRKQFKAGGQS